MVEQKKIGPFNLDGERRFEFLQNPTTNGYSDGYSIRYYSRTCGNKNGWISLGTVKEPYIETAKMTVLNYFELISDEDNFIDRCKGNFRRNKSTVEIDVGGKRRVNSNWIPIINSFIDGLFENEQEDIEGQMTLMEAE